MFLAGNFMNAIAMVLDSLLTVYMWMIIIAALLSWVNPDPYNPIVRFLRSVAEPVLGRIRRFLPYMGGIDVSPMIAILFIMFLKYFLIASLVDFATRLR